MINMKRSLLSVAVASGLVWSLNASAVVDLNAPTIVPDTFASELTIVAPATKLTLTHSGIDANTTVGINTDSIRYVRVDLSNGAKFAAAPTLIVTPSGAGNPVETVVEGGAGSSYVIFSVATASTLGTDDVPIGNNMRVGGNIDVVNTVDAVTATVAIYETQTAASVNPTTAFLGSATSGTVVSWASGLNFSVAATNQTAEVETSFLQFVGPATSKPIGTVTYAAAAGVLDSDGSAIGLGDLIASAKLVLSGDFNFAQNNAGTGYVLTAVQLGAGPTDANAVTATSATFNAAAAGVINFTAQNNASGNSALQESTYSVLLDITAAATTGAGTPVTIADKTASAGTISRNGTVVQVPYLTTFEDYNQRLVVVNRGATSAEYSVSFTTEAGVTATAGAQATGVLAGNSTTIIKATDLVTLTGGTRTAATLTVVTPSGNIDAATTQVNLSDKSTDTVKLK